MADTAVFYFDFNSPYAYLAAERIDGMLPDAEWKPIAFPILLQALGRLDKALATDPAPALAEVRERAAARGLPRVEPPASWPVESWSFLPLRAALVADETGRIREFCSAAWRLMFVEGRALTELETVRDAARVAGLDPDKIEDAVQRPGIKDRLKGNTDEAIARGVPGIPTFAVGDELFWGDDHLEEASAAASGAA